MSTRSRDTSGVMQKDDEVRDLFRLSIAMLCIAGRDGYFKRVNPAFERALGYTSEELLSRPFIEFVHPQDQERTLAEVRRLSGGTPTIHFENRYRCRDGSYRWLAWTATPRDGGERIYATAIDITDGKRAEEALRRSEERYRRLLEAVTTYTYTVLLREGVVVSTNHGPGCLAATGYGPADYAADPGLWITTVHPEDRDMVRRRVARVLRGEEVPPVEHRVIHRNGTTRWIRDTIVPHRDRGGVLVRYDGVVEDITERRNAEARFRQLLEYAPDAMVIVDQNGRIVLVNARAERLFGYRRGELFGKSVEMLIPEGSRGAHRAHCAAYCRSPQIGLMGDEVRFRGLRKDGTEFPAAVSLSPLRTDEGLLVMSEIHDLTKRRQVEEEKEAALRIQEAVSSLLRALLESTSLEEKLEKTLDLLLSVPWLSVESKGCVYLVERDPRQLVMKVHRGLPEALLRTCRTVPFGKCLCGRAAATRELVYADCLDGSHETRHSGIRPHGHYCVPIVSGDRVHGVIDLYVKEGTKRQPTEEAFLLAVADALAGATERHRAEEALRHDEAQFLAAQKVQELLLPQETPALAGFDVGGATYPAEFAGGDYFDYVPMPDGSMCFVVGDVSGHGVAPALLTATTRVYLRLLARQHSDIGETLTAANDLLARETEDRRFICLFCGRLDPVARSFTYASAGHPTAYWLASSGRVKGRLDSTSLPLAVMPDVVFTTRGPIALAEGDILLMLTDGVYEATSRDGRPFGKERTLKAVRVNSTRPAREIVECLYRAVRAFTGREKLDDDVTAVVIKAEGPTRGAT